jgi:hypothetical protein
MISQPTSGLRRRARRRPTHRWYELFCSPARPSRRGEMARSNIPAQTDARHRDGLAWSEHDIDNRWGRPGNLPMLRPRRSSVSARVGNPRPVTKPAGRPASVQIDCDTRYRRTAPQRRARYVPCSVTEIAAAAAGGRDVETAAAVAAGARAVCRPRHGMRSWLLGCARAADQQ